MIGTILPQMAAALPATTATSPDLASEVLALAITALVLLSFLHGAPRGALTAQAAALGRWLLIGGIGGGSGSWR